MVKFKTIRTKRGIRKVKVLSNGQYRFVRMSKRVNRNPLRKRTRVKSRRVYTMARKKKGYRKSRSSMLTPEIKGMAGAVLYDAIVSPMIPLEENTKNIVELVGGFMLRKKSGWIGATGKTLFILNGYALLRNLIGDKLGQLTNPTGNNNLLYGGV